MRASARSDFSACSASSWRPVGFAFFVLALLLFFVCLLPQPGWAVIYTQQREDDTLFLTNDKRKVPERQKSAPADTKAEEESAAEQASKRDMELSRLAFQLESGFKAADVDRILRLFEFFPAKATPRALFTLRGNARAFFKRFFETFGPTMNLVEGNSSQETLHLTRLYSAHKDVLDQVDCGGFQYHNYLATLENKEGAVSLSVGVCSPQDQRKRPFIKDMGVALVAPDQAMQAKAEAFKEEYKKDIAAVAEEFRELQAKKEQSRQKAEADARQQAEKAKAAQKQPQTPAVQQQPQTQTPTMPFPQGQMPQMPQMPGAGEGMGLVNPMLLMGFLSGTMITLFMAAGVFFYLFYCLCTYAIARKLDVPNPWLAWIPIAQVHPQVLSAGLPGWWTGALIGAIVLSAVPFVGFLLSLAVFVAFVWIWMRISERLFVNKWLGLLIILPIVQFVYPAWLAFKADAMRAKVGFKNVLSKTLLAFLLLSALCWLATTYFITPALEPMLSMFQNMQNMQNAQPIQNQGQSQPVMPESLPQQPQPQAPAKMPDAAAPQSGAEPDPGPKIQSLSREDYEKLLASLKAPETDGDKRPSIRLGPAVVRYDTFWAEAESPHFWLKVILPLLPNMELGPGGRLTVDNVLDTNGENMYDKDNTFEKGRFLELKFMEHSFNTPSLQAIRNVHLKQNATEASLASVSGELTLLLPLDITTLDLSLAAPVQEAHGFMAELKKIEGNQASLVLTGNPEQHAGTIAYDAQGARLDQKFSSWNTVDNVTRINYGYDAEPERIEVLVASGRLEKNYPFTLDIE